MNPYKISDKTIPQSEMDDILDKIDLSEINEVSYNNLFQSFRIRFNGMRIISLNMSNNDCYIRYSHNPFTKEWGYRHGEKAIQFVKKLSTYIDDPIFHKVFAEHFN